jgi:sterol desaturase/sphingolipid hydroxylase (fatty acid hydroxylase superfamily)
MDYTFGSLPIALGQTLNSFILMAVIFVPLELAFARRVVPVMRRQFWVDVGFFFLNSILPGALLALLVGYLVFLVKPIYSTGLYAWLGALPIWIKFPLAIIVGDFGAYWGHRWSHEIPFLWSFHKVHHEAEAIDWLVTNRAHPVDMVLLKFSGLLLIYLTGFAQGSLGQGTALMSVYAFLATLWGFFVHANVSFRFGFLEKWLATPAFHHWHHSNESPETINKNYAAIFPWIDRMFGTYHLPSRRWPASCGLRIAE